MTGWENYILYSWNTCSNSNSIVHFLYIDLPMYLQERRKENIVCAAWEYPQLPLKPCSVLGRFGILTFLLNNLEVSGFNIHQAHLNTQYLANDCILLFERRLSPLPFLAFIILQRAKYSAPWTICIWSLQPVLSSAEKILGDCSCRQDTGAVLWNLCWPHLSARNCPRSQHTTAILRAPGPCSWRKHLSEKGAHFTKGNQLFFPPRRQMWRVLSVPQSIGLLTSIFTFKVGPTCHILWGFSWGCFSEPQLKSLDTTMQSPCAKSQHRLRLSVHPWKLSWSFTVLC